MHTQTNLLEGCLAHCMEVGGRVLLSASLKSYLQFPNIYDQQLLGRNKHLNNPHYLILLSLACVPKLQSMIGYKGALLGLIISIILYQVLYNNRSIKIQSNTDMESTQSFLEIGADSDFSIQNIPFGVFSPTSDPSLQHCATRIGDWVIDLTTLEREGFFTGPLFTQLRENSVFPFNDRTLNVFIGLERKYWVEARSTIQSAFAVGSPLSSQKEKLEKIVYKHDAVIMRLPAKIGDYTDFYSSYNHAYNMGVMIRGKDNAMQPNWYHLPVGYHGRASSIVASGHPVVHARGQVKNEKEGSDFAESKRVDFELEMGCFIGGKTNQLGTPIKVNDAWDNVFGLVLLNDWSFRDFQTWEYVPLGPFTAKNAITTISPWIVTLEALNPQQVLLKEQEPAPLKYLQEKVHKSFDVELSVEMSTQNGSKAEISKTNLKYMYWTFAQQLAHHTITGCNFNPGDLIATGTISGPEKGSFGSLMEISWGGKEPFKVGDEERTFMKDGDSITLRGHTTVNGKRVGFGECTGKLVPALPEESYY